MNHLLKYIPLIALALLFQFCGQAKSNKEEQETKSIELEYVEEVAKEEIPLTIEHNAEEEVEEEIDPFAIQKSTVEGVKVGSSIAQLQQPIAAPFRLQDDVLMYGTDEEGAPVLGFYKEDKLLFHLVRDINNADIIKTIILYSSDYYIKNTHIKVGSTVAELRATFRFKDHYFAMDDGLYIYTEGFDGAFKIDLEGTGHFDYYDSLEPLEDHFKILEITIY